MDSAPRRVALSAASFTRLARSAPEKPGVLRGDVARGRRRAPSGLPRVCTCRIARRAGDRGPLDDDAPIEPAGPQQSRIEHVGPVGRREHDGQIAPREAVHLREELVQRLLALVVAPAEPGPARRDPRRRSRR